MSVRCFLIVFFYLFLVERAQAIEIQYFDKQMDLSNTRPGYGNRCHQIFSTRMYGSRIATVSPRGVRHSSLQFFSAQTIDPRIQRSMVEIMRSWELSGHYTPENIKFLLEREATLSPLRTKYFQIKEDEHIAGIRVLDASTQVMNFGSRWFQNSIDESLSSIEKKYEFIFPERRAHSDSYIWELGLLVSPQHFRGGAPAVMANMAFLLDAHYNQADYRTFGDTESIANLDFQIYGIAREPLVKHYKKYGFEPIWMVDGNGETRPYQLPDGLILIKVSGQRFIELNFDNPQHPATFSGTSAQDVQSIAETIEHLRFVNREIRSQEIPIFPSRENWQAVWNSLMPDLLQKVESETPETAAWQGAYYDLVRMGYLMLQSPRAEEGDRNIATKRMFFKELLSEGPASGLQLYREFILNNRGAYERDYDSSFFRFDPF